MEKYLTELEHEKFNQFLIKRKIRRVAVAKILSLKDGGSITQYFKNKTFRRNDFEKVRKVLKDRALEGFEEIEF